ncbi:alpha-glucuronidase family glycosyl hydrolase [Salinimonas chungwhensis]|uniref:alpha-glucuronidase family glycosyl hydrolase n=1 Tax=Salinimonas chungwhensis TaxID=265425 RepID=UPI000378D595|nr:alpha-glucuronidase family glycosyl hydrolase [Salinimonas chungwhensis]
MKYIVMICVLLVSVSSLASSIIEGEDGYRLWLKYDPITSASLKKKYTQQVGRFHVTGDTETMQVVRDELNYALNGMLTDATVVSQKQAGLLVVAGDQASSLAASNSLDLKSVGDEGYVIHQTNDGDASQILVLANTDVGALYGTYRLLRQLQTHQPLDGLSVSSSPDIDLRVLNHWDNLDRHVERGYAGQSIWDWHKLPDYRYQRYIDYARANASIGINGTVLNNVNADPLILTPHYLTKVKALADMFRPYGIKVYLSVKFSSPQLIGDLDTSDPLDPEVRQWWKDKVADVYQQIPDFGGFLVKANSEGQPGPGDFGRTHAEGANMLASALAPHGGTVMWRAFVYANEKNEERSKQAYSEFKPLDGKFKDNVLVQVKNGPIDFQPREPFSPLFGAMPDTPLMMEFQITMEYLGFSTHFVYLGSMYEEVLQSDTYARGEGSTVAKVIDGDLFNHNVTGMAGVANIGTDRNWTGHIILQSNWYVFGRMAWDPQVSAKTVADDWIRMTLSNDDKVVASVSDMMMKSHEVTVNTMTPLGLHHIMGAGHHYGPAPWVDSLGRADWNSVYYHRAAKDGIGFDRSESGVNAVEQYFSPLKEQLSDPATTPEKYLLWFHHLPWDYEVKSSGRTLWNELVHRYYQGAADVEEMADTWDSLEGKLDPLQFHQVQMAMDIHEKEAIWWRNACVLYFQQFSGQPIPETLPKPEKSLADYQKMSFPHAPGQG